MNWSHELLDSLRWLAQAFVLCLTAFAVAAALLARHTGWGRQFWRLARGHFAPRRGERASWRPLVGFALILLLTLAAVRLNVLFSFWYNGFYSALQKLDGPGAWYFLGLFGVLASVHVARALIAYFVTQAFLLRWRTALNDYLVERWLGRQAYYRTQYVGHKADNPDQCIQQDVETFVTVSVDLATGVVGAVVSLIAFTGILWGLSGPLDIFGIRIERAMVWLAYLYVIVATLIAFRIGRPLIRLSFLREKFNANYRYGLLRLREYGESVAFYHGEAMERGNFSRHFGRIVSNVWDIIHRTLKLSGFNLAISQAAVVFPYLVQLPRFLAKQISLGDMMQTGNAFNQVQDALSFFRESYDSFAGYRAVLDRLTGFLDAIEAADALPRPAIDRRDDGVEIAGLTLTRPDGGRLLDELSLAVHRGRPLLVRGSSGCGKTTLLRAIAGLWPHGQGKVRLPDGARPLFLSQKPYLPLGSLRDALHYPGTAPAKDGDEREAGALTRCGLAHLIPQLGRDADWSHILSLGEQQRLAFGRILLNRPDIVFLDEATSAVDEAQEARLYRMLAEELPHTVVVSVGHRNSLRAFHRDELTLAGDGGWRLDAIA